MAKTKDISSRLQLLQEKLEEEIENRDNVITPTLGPNRRPNNCENFFFDYHFGLIFIISMQHPIL